MSYWAFHLGPDESHALPTRKAARMVRDVLKEQGHDAHVEKDRGSGSRVWVQHPEHKDTVAYYGVDDHDKMMKGDGKGNLGKFDPYWISKVK